MIHECNLRMHLHVGITRECSFLFFSLPFADCSHAMTVPSCIYATCFVSFPLSHLPLSTSHTPHAGCGAIIQVSEVTTGGGLD